ncbi:DUF167 domain-containing protein [Rhizobium sp. Rhizsp82]|uniref:DUF167 domain-containing protein n=1 Tax=Rhizobium sp. Rhizsp82 TaxID=3243057 RepID=UPI0039B6B5D7
MSSAWTVHDGHLRLTVRLTPNGGRDAIDGLDGEGQLKVRVSAVPEDGKANKALIALLAKSLRVPKSAVAFISRETSRKKILRIEGDTEDLIEKLKAFTKA